MEDAGWSHEELPGSGTEGTLHRLGNSLCYYFGARFFVEFSMRLSGEIEMHANESLLKCN